MGYGSVVVVRDARLDDIDWLITELRAFSEFSTYQHKLFPPDEIEVRVKVKALIETQFVRIAELDHVTSVRGEPFPEIRIGFIAGLHGEHWFNPAIHTFTELFWWVQPEHRGSSAGVRLLEAFIDEGERRRGWIVFGLEHNSPVKDETLIKRGFRAQERSFLKEVA
jgi:hypothetical protein